MHEQHEHILMTSEDRMEAAQYFTLMVEEEKAAMKRRQQQFDVSLRKKKDEVRKSLTMNSAENKAPDDR